MIRRAQETPTPTPPAGRTDPRVRRVAWLAIGLGLLVALGFGAALALLFWGCVFTTWFVVPAVARFALRRNVTGLPGGRAIHAARTPLLGGIAISVPLVLYLLGNGSALALGLAAGCALMVAVGACDDLKGLRPRHKIAAQVAGACVLMAAGYRVPELLVPPFGSVATTGFEMVLVLFWVVLVTNAINLIDGMDGLAATVSFVAALACAALGLWPAAALALAGATLGFLRHNLPQARIFLGDAGSLLLGFAVAALLLNGKGPMNLPVALGVIALPLGDVALATARRWLRGKPVFSGDRGHVHHRLLDAWKRPSRVLFGLGAFSAALAAVVYLFPDLGGLAGVSLLWAGALAYLLNRARPRWTRILLNRRSFRRLHVVRQYAAESLRLAEDAADVRALLERVAEDFDLASLRIRTLSVTRPAPPGVMLVEEHIDCGETTASWSAVFVPTDPVLAEEKRTILCELLRVGDARLAALGDAPRRPVPAPSPPPPVPEAAGGPPRVHFIADSRDRLARISPFVRETRRRAVLEPVVVHTGARDDLGLTGPQMRELELEPPAVDLDVAPEPGIAQTARVMERYDALVRAARPSVVVVGDSAASVACALVAREHGIAVAHVGAPAGGSVADITLGQDQGRRPAAGQLLFPAAPGGARAEVDAAQVVPALEALLLSGAPPR